jgi:hypothetical protein
MRMKAREELLNRLPQEGFLKITSSRPRELSDDQKIGLIRKGNALFNAGQHDLAKRIFITTGYTDGLIRLGDLYMKDGKPLEALRMYLLAPDREKADLLLEGTVRILQKWLKEENKKVGEG